MTDVVPNLSIAPGCFGMAMTYRESARECSACPFASSCAPLAAQNLVVLRTELGIDVLEPAPVAKTPKKIANAEVLVDGPLPKKVAEHLERTERLGIRITPALARGENPFKGHKLTFLTVAFHVLLKVKAGISRDLLVQCLVAKLGHSEKAASAYVKQTVQFLEAVGAGFERNGLIQLKVNES